MGNYARPFFCSIRRVAVAVVAAWVVVTGCSTGPSADEQVSTDLRAAADRGDWPRVRAMYKTLVVPELGDYYPGEEGVVWRGGWLQEKPAGKLKGVERVAVEVARQWRRIDIFPPGAGENAAPEPVPDILPDVPADAQTARPATLDGIPALLALHRCTWMTQESPDAVVATFEQYAQRWERALERVRAAETEEAEMPAWVRQTYGALLKAAVDVYWWLPPPIREPHRRLRRYLDTFLQRFGDPAVTAATESALMAYETAWSGGIVSPSVPADVMASVDAALGNDSKPSALPQTMPYSPENATTNANPAAPANAQPTD